MREPIHATKNRSKHRRDKAIVFMNAPGLTINTRTAGSLSQLWRFSFRRSISSGLNPQTPQSTPKFCILGTPNWPWLPPTLAACPEGPWRPAPTGAAALVIGRHAVRANKRPCGWWAKKPLSLFGFSQYPLRRERPALSSAHPVVGLGGYSYRSARLDHLHDLSQPRDPTNANASMSTAPQNERLDLKESLRRYWTNLIGVALFPSVFFLSLTFAPVPVPVIFAFLMPMFFAVSLHAGWPYLRQGAPYTFWLVACGAWMAGAVLSLMLLEC